jgi:hypothetical protein
MAALGGLRGDGAAAASLQPSTAQDDNGAAFQDHILLVLSSLSATVSPSASLSAPLLATPVPVVPAFQGPGASSKTEAILGELQLLALRLHDSEQRERVAQAKLVAALNSLPNGTALTTGEGVLLTPDATPPLVMGGDDSAARQQSVSNRLKSSPTYPLPAPPFSPAAGGGSILTSGNINMYESGLGPTEELRLLRAQVQDIARVCKVRPALASAFAACHNQRTFLLTCHPADRFSTGCEFSVAY